MLSLMLSSLSLRHLLMGREIKRKSCGARLLLALLLSLLRTGFSNDDRSGGFVLNQGQIYILDNVSLLLDNKEVKGHIDKGGLLYVYKVLPRKCLEHNSSQLLVTLHTSSQLDGGYKGTAHFNLAVNARGVIPLHGTKSNGTTIFQSIADMRYNQLYAIARVVIPNDYPITIPWYIGVSSTRAPSNFSLKAQCLEEISITNIYNRRKISGQTLDYGAWQYFTLNVLGNTSRILVEISCSHDNMVLLLKPISGGHLVSDMLPSKLDMEHYGDMASLKNRLSHLYRFTIGKGRFFIGIFNNDGGIQENAYFNATIAVESLESSVALCPRNCSYPRGHCIEDNVCRCENGHGGPFCEGYVRELKSWATLLIALCCSISVFLFTIVLTTILQRYLQSGGQMNEESDLAEITTDGSHIQHSLNKTVIEKCPTLDFIEGTMLTREAKCSICLSKYVSGDRLREIPLCSHRFHIHCIEAWLLRNLTCPLCRSDLLSLSTMPKNA